MYLPFVGNSGLVNTTYTKNGDLVQVESAVSAGNVTTQTVCIGSYYEYQIVERLTSTEEWETFGEEVPFEAE